MALEADFTEFKMLVAQALEVDPEEIRRETTAANVNGWDSVSHASLIMTLEETYAIEFSDSEIFKFENVGALFDRTMHLSGRASA